NANDADQIKADPHHPRSIFLDLRKSFGQLEVIGARLRVALDLDFQRRLLDAEVFAGDRVRWRRRRHVAALLLFGYELSAPALERLVLDRRRRLTQATLGWGITVTLYQPGGTPDPESARVVPVVRSS